MIFQHTDEDGDRLTVRLQQDGGLRAIIDNSEAGRRVAADLPRSDALRLHHALGKALGVVNE